MMEMKTRFLTFFVILAISILLHASLINAQPPLPERPGEEWPPPEEGIQERYPFGIGSTSIPGGGGGAVTAHLEDSAGRWRDEIIGSEAFFLILWTPSLGGLRIVEFYPPGGPIRRHWLIWWMWLPVAGQYKIGPFYPEHMEPEGEHAWDIGVWFGGTWHRLVLRFNYWRMRPTPTPTPTPTNVPTSLTLSVTPQEISIGNSAIASVSISPSVTGGTIEIQQSKDGVSWISIGSGQASSGGLSAPFAPAEPGNYYIRATYSGYFDSKANKNYLASQSQAFQIKVSEMSTGVTISVRPEELAINVLTREVGSALISGYLKPPIPGASVKLLIEGPVSIERELSTASDGSFTYFFSPTEPGEYYIKAFYQGDETHKPSASQIKMLKVREEWSAAYGLIAVIAVAAVAISFILYKKKIPKRSEPPKT